MTNHAWLKKWNIAATAGNVMTFISCLFCTKRWWSMATVCIELWGRGDRWHLKDEVQEADTIAFFRPINGLKMDQNQTRFGPNRPAASIVVPWSWQSGHMPYVKKVESKISLIYVLTARDETLHFCALIRAVRVVMAGRFIRAVWVIRVVRVLPLYKK